MVKVLLVTITLGYYEQLYPVLFKRSHEVYAKKHGYDFKVIKENLAYPHYSCITFSKMLLCSQPFSVNYDFIIFVDADILINPNTPSLHNLIDYGDKIGMVDQSTQPNKEKYRELEGPIVNYYKSCGLDDLDSDIILNSGLIVMQPSKHKKLLENIYNKYVMSSINHPRKFQFEQTVLGYELQKDNSFVVLPSKWNTLWWYYKNDGQSLQECYEKNYLIHFAGNCDFDKVHTVM